MKRLVITRAASRDLADISDYFLAQSVEAGDRFVEQFDQKCQFLFLLSQLKLASLTDDQKGDILAELTGAICHLHVHTEGLPRLVEDEILALPEGD